jgi:uncharacterized membrane protein
MGQRNVVVVRFAEPSKAYQALTVLKQCDAEGRIDLEGAAVVERTAAGGLVVPEKDDDVDYAGFVGGSVIGMLVGVLGGPVGVLLGMGTGALVGGAVDIDRADTSEEALTVLGRSIPPGSTALMASVEESAIEVIDAEMYGLGGEVTRRPVSEVMVELAATEEAQEAAAREARRVVREKRKAELHANVEEHVGAMKEKLHAS